MPALSALHSAVQSFAVFKPVAVVCLGAAGDAVSAGLAAGAAGDGSAPPLHCSTYALSVTPRACITGLVGAPFRRALFRGLCEGWRYGDTADNSSGDKPNHLWISYSFS